MKKYFPMALFFSIIAVLFLAKLAVDSGRTIANQSEDDKAKIAHYETALRNIKVKDDKGQEITYSTLKAPIVVINFWASWCQPCLKEFPSLVELRKKYSPAEIAIIGINADMEDQEKNFAKTIKDYKLNFQNVLDKESDVLNAFMITAIPVSIIYHNGKVIDVSNGEKDFMSAELLKKFSTILKK